MPQPMGLSVGVNVCVAPFLLGEDMVVPLGTREDWRAEHFEAEEDMLEWVGRYNAWIWARLANAVENRSRFCVIRIEIRLGFASLHRARLPFESLYLRSSAHLHPYSQWI
ncbi:hypothetical protein M422DRAFT_38313 [Sphaerobolus stellatus SS14]|uniref:Uncharacterized protein n=1 Tax=Sphaerobolus stellatus (strain SS14) TaxID=990650 RepID=A0A0C9TAT9_SPHS4|nr:hypothetical protein M422DRAFT_38313 [Sphaerobolus stellatus SS14]